MSTETSAVQPSQAEFAEKWLGMDPAMLAEDTDTPETVTPDDAETPEAITPDEDEVDEEVEEEEGEDEEPDAKEKPADAPEPVKLPFAAKSKDADVDAALLADMTITFKADGKEVTMPIADVVRRAQSEPAVQRQARQYQDQVTEARTQMDRVQQQVDEVRAIALKMARDPDYYAQMVEDIEGYDLPEARAQRAETALATRDREQTESRERAEHEQRLQEFATSEVAPALSHIVTSNPLVTEEEILGKFYADTAKITVNGVIPPEYHASLAQYLRTTLTEFVEKRQSEYASRESRAKAEALKTQRARQKLKNQSALGAKPVGTSGALRDTPAPTQGRTIKEAEGNALNTLLAGLT